MTQEDRTALRIKVLLICHCVVLFRRNHEVVENLHDDNLQPFLGITFANLEQNVEINLCLV